METRASVEELRPLLVSIFGQIWELEIGGEVPELVDETVLLDTGLDSLGFAIYIGELDAEIGYDPFSIADDGYYPVTFKDFLDFYTEHFPA